MPLAQSSSGTDWPTIPGYEILGVLGHGGMGVVYQARQIELGRVVAVKMIQSGSGAGHEEHRRFRAEAEAVARLQHPNIVHIYEVGECRGLPYFSLEYVAGGNLARRIAASLPPPDQAATLVETLARAVHYAHQCGILHRDLKPANILLSGNSRPEETRQIGSGLDQIDTVDHKPEPLGTPKITDFGLAKQLDADSGQTRSGAVLGTPSYMAPEQAAGQTAAIGPRTDVYALGAILYELLTGRPPFRAASVLETLDQVRHREPAPPRQLQPGLPRDLETICLTCLQKESARRYPSALALADDLRRFQSGEPITARPVGVFERSWRWCRRKPALASLSAALVVLTAVAFVVVTVFGLQADRERRRVATLNASLTLERGQTYCEQGDINRGMLWMAHALQLVPDEAYDLQRVIRANLAGWSRLLHPLEAIFPHGDRVQAVAFSPDGSKVAVAGGDGRVQLWELATGKPLGPALAHENKIAAVTFSPNGRLVATATRSGAHWWEVATGRRLGPAVHQRDPVDQVLFSPDSTRLLSYTGIQDSVENAQLWNVDSGAAIGPPLWQQSNVVSGAFSRDGKLVLAGGPGGTRIWDAATGEPAGHLREDPKRFVNAAVFRPDGRTIVTSSLVPFKIGRTISHWNTATGERVAGPHVLEPIEGETAVPPVLDDKGTLLFTSLSFHARLWNTATGKAIGEAMKHDAPVNGAAFTPDLQRVITASADFTARVWDTVTTLPLGSPLQHHDAVAHVAVSPDGQTALTGSHDRTAKLWRLSPPLTRVLRHEKQVLAVIFSPDGKTIWTGCDLNRSSIRSWYAKTGLPAPRSFSTAEGVRALAVSRDGQVLAAGSKNRSHRWNASSGVKIDPDLVVEGRKADVFAQAFSPDGARLAIGHKDGFINVWDMGANRPLYPPLKHGGEVRAVDFSPDGRLLMTAADDRSVRFWNAATGEPVGDKRVYNGAVLAAVFSPDGKSYLTGSNDRIARPWDTVTGAPVGPALSHDDIVLAVAFSRDGRLILTGSARSARLWDAATGKTIGPPIPHKGYVWSVAISPDGKMLASGSWDQTVQLLQTPEPVNGTVADVIRWVQVVTGHELDGDGSIRVLDAASWRERRGRLEEATAIPTQQP